MDQFMSNLVCEGYSSCSTEIWPWKCWNATKKFLLCDTQYSIILFANKMKCKWQCKSLWQTSRLSSWYFPSSRVKDPSQTLVRGAWCKKKLFRQFFGAPFRPQKNFRAPLFATKIMGQPHRRACKTQFFLENFFHTMVNNFKGPSPFGIRPPLQVFVNGP